MALTQAAATFEIVPVAVTCVAIARLPSPVFRTWAVARPLIPVTTAVAVALVMVEDRHKRVSLQLHAVDDTFPW